MECQAREGSGAVGMAGLRNVSPVRGRSGKQRGEIKGLTFLVTILASNCGQLVIYLPRMSQETKTFQGLYTLQHKGYPLVPHLCVCPVYYITKQISNCLFVMRQDYHPVSFSGNFEKSFFHHINFHYAAFQMTWSGWLCMAPAQPFPVESSFFILSNQNVLSISN